MRNAPDYPVPALEKGLDILEALAAEPSPQSLAELAARLERSSSELFRMLNCLERRGYVAREAVSGKYGITLKLFALAHAHSATEKLLEAARRPMRALTETLRVSCHLSVLERGRLLVIAQELSPEPVRLSIEVGASFAAEQTASGRLLRAWESAVVAGKARAAQGKVFAQIRRRGYSDAESETIEGVRDLAVLVGKPGAGLNAALAVTRLLKRGQKADETRLLAGMRAAAAEITRALGLRGAGGGVIAEAGKGGSVEKKKARTKGPSLQ